LDPATLSNLIAVVIGGLLATTGGIVSALVIERQRQKIDAHNLALAFKGEISAILNHFEFRNYDRRFGEVIEQIEASGEPFFMPFRIRYTYDRIYEENAERIGLLRGHLPEQIPFFYTLMRSVMEDMASLGDGTFAGLELEVLLRIYRDARRGLGTLTTHGQEIIREIDRQYG
jgi:hypothetical protein